MLRNKIVSKQLGTQTKSRHDLRLKTIKAVVSSTSPISLTARVTNAKKIQLLEEKYTEIERENRVLYEKMLVIKNRTPLIRTSCIKKSLNETSRKLRQQEITHENSQLLERISRKQSFYRSEKLKNERKDTEKYLSTISELPLICPKKKLALTGSFFRKSPMKDTGSSVLVLRQGKILNGKSFLIEIYKYPDKLKIVAFDLENPEKFIDYLLPGEVKEICGEESDMKKLASKIRLGNGGLFVKTGRSLSVKS